MPRPRGRPRRPARIKPGARHIVVSDTARDIQKQAADVGALLVQFGHLNAPYRRPSWWPPGLTTLAALHGRGPAPLVLMLLVSVMRP